MEFIILFLVIITIPIMIAMMAIVKKKTTNVEKELKTEIIKNKEEKDIHKENSYYLEIISKDLNSTKNTLKLFLFIYILPTIITLILVINIIIKIENLKLF